MEPMTEERLQLLERVSPTPWMLELIAEVRRLNRLILSERELHDQERRKWEIMTSAP